MISSLLLDTNRFGGALNKIMQENCVKQKSKAKQMTKKTMKCVGLIHSLSFIELRQFDRHKSLSENRTEYAHTYSELRHFYSQTTRKQ